MIIMENESITVDSEREEGEIVDELDDLSDISSEEEYLLRQRLEVLENYNNVLERKEAKRTSMCWTEKSAKIDEKDKTHVLKQITHKSDGNIIVQKVWKDKHKKKKDEQSKIKDIKRRRTQRLKKVDTIDSESSDDAEYKNKRVKLANAVLITQKNKTDTTLKERLMKMLCIPNTNKNKNIINDNRQKVIEEKNGSKITSVIQADISQSSFTSIQPLLLKNDEMIIETNVHNQKNTNNQSRDEVDTSSNKTKEITPIPYLEQKEVSDDDLEMLRQHALKSKAPKPIHNDIQAVEEPKILISDDEDEDSDTTELRLICLRSALLKKAIEMKQKQKLQKRLSQSTLYDDVVSSEHEAENEKDSIDNNTDIESVDMDIGSDHDEPVNDPIHDSGIDITKGYKEETENPPIPVPDEFEEDEDILRTKLLTSLCKNLKTSLPSEENTEINVTPPTEKSKDILPSPVTKEQENTRFIINTADSDSEGEHEATKNLTKMHIKLSEDFQQKLDIFLKSKRIEVEKSNKGNVQKQSPILGEKSPSKFIPKAVNHLPKSEQQEYRDLVKRMAELEKIKQARQAVMVERPKLRTGFKDTTKPKVVPVNHQIINIDEQISLSRKKIAEESAKVLKLKEEGLKLSQKYKIVETELKNLGTALSLNKREYRSAQIKLSKIRSQHQFLLKRSFIQPHNLKPDFNLTNVHTKNTSNKKENLIKVNKMPADTRIVRKNIANHNQNTKVKEQNNSKSIAVTKDVKVTAVPSKIKNKSTLLPESKQDVVRKDVIVKENSDYHSPLQAFTSSSWDGDPNAVLCPFEVTGSCKDDTCQYFHTNSIPN